MCRALDRCHDGQKLVSLVGASMDARHIAGCRGGYTGKVLSFLQSSGCSVISDWIRMSQKSVPAPQPSGYRGSVKHKNRPIDVRKGTLCPEWTHESSRGGFQSDPYSHDWKDTQANELFDSSVLSEDGRRRFATARGIAFEAKPTGDGTWHGYPIPWEHVPANILSDWKSSQKVSRRDIKQHFRYAPNELYWALTSDDTHE